MRKIFLKFGISLEDAELGHFTLLFCKNRQRNEQREESITRSPHDECTTWPFQILLLLFRILFWNCGALIACWRL